MVGNKLQDIYKKVNAILKELSVNFLPIQIGDIAMQLGLKLIPYPFTDDISGTLVIEGDKAVIGFNQSESRVRRRFTIAHELGHYILHKEKSSIFLDKQFKVHFRSTQSQQTERHDVQIMEQEANAFAAAILMPESLIRQEIKKIDFDLGSEEAIKYLARTFDVSSQAMTFRLANLELFNMQ